MELVSLYILAVFCLITCLTFWTNTRKKRHKLLPGPQGLPIIGNAHQVGRRPHLKFAQWAREFGPVFRAKLSNMEIVVLSDHKIIKELFSENAASGRMLDNPLIYEFTRGNYGVVNAEGSNWEQQRRFMLRTLRDFGFGKTSTMESLILDEAHAVVKWFKRFNGKPVPAVKTFNPPVMNSLWTIVTGERCDWEENRPEILDVGEKVFSAGQECTANGILFLPMLRFLAPEVTGWNRYISGVDKMNNVIRNAVKMHEESFNENNLRDFIDCHLKEIKTAKDKEIGYKNLVAGVFDLFIAGSETTSNTLSWTLMYLSSNLKIQDKIYQEIERVVGTRTPSLSDRAEMPYVEAVIAESLRMSSVLPNGVPHRMQKDLWFQGYYIPEGTYLFANIFSVHNNPDIWGDPENFRPERFLNENETKFVKHEALISFSEGKRKCIGETLGKDTLFLFLTTLVQEFNILPESDKPADMEPALGFFLLPKPFSVIMAPRMT